MSTPNLSRIGLVNESDVTAAQNRVDTLLKEVEHELEERGIPNPPRPSNHPEPLADMDISLLTNAQLSSLYTQYVAYAAYIGDELAKIEGQEESSKRQLRELLATLKDALYAKGAMKPVEVTSAAMKDELFKELDLQHEKLFFMKSIMKRRYRSYVTQAQALSRTVELRKLDFEQTRRDGNLNRPPAARGFGNTKPDRYTGKAAAPNKKSP